MATQRLKSVISDDGGRLSVEAQLWATVLMVMLLIVRSRAGRPALEKLTV